VDEKPTGRDMVGVGSADGNVAVKSLDLKIDIDLDSNNDDDEDGAQRSWHKSPLRVRRVRRRDGRPVSAEINFDSATRKLYIHSLGSGGERVEPGLEPSANNPAVVAGNPRRHHSKNSQGVRRSESLTRRLSIPDRLPLSTDRKNHDRPAAIPHCNDSTLGRVSAEAAHKV